MCNCPSTTFDHSSQVGVAPGSEWIHAAVIDRVSISRTVSDAILSFQWLIDPDGNPETNWDVPSVCSNSWGLVTSHGYPECDETFWVYLDACEAAGIVILFSAGNEGYSGLRRPADRATDDYRTCAVASVNANYSHWPISSFSSRGPTYCTLDGSPATKPDISAPGENVRSSVPGGGYSNYSGTSMASPHVNGVVALMREANPDLAVDEIKQIIYDTAYDLGSPGEDNDYGWGMIDAYEAVLEALARSTIGFEFPDGFPDLLDPDGGTTIRVNVVAGGEATPQPGTGLLYYDDGGGFTQIAMDEVSNNIYDAVFPPFECLDTVDYYFSAETTDGETIYNPRQAPAQTYSAFVAQGMEVIFDDDFETANGWTITYNDLSSGRWVRGIPDGTVGTPEEDFDGSGQCYLTGDMSYEDVDGGPVRLISPTFAIDDTGWVGFAAWLYSASGNPDVLSAEISNNDGATWTQIAEFEDADTWREHQAVITDFITPTQTMKMRFVVSDNPDDSRTEACVDAFQVIDLYCDRMGLDVDPLYAGADATMTATDATPGQTVYFVYSLDGLGSYYVSGLGITLNLDDPRLADSAVADGAGNAEIQVSVPGNAGGVTVWLQAAEDGRKSVVVNTTIN